MYWALLPLAEGRYDALSLTQRHLTLFLLLTASHDTFRVKLLPKLRVPEARHYGKPCNDHEGHQRFRSHEDAQEHNHYQERHVKRSNANHERVKLDTERQPLRFLTCTVVSTIMPGHGIKPLFCLRDASGDGSDGSMTLQTSYPSTTLTRYYTLYLL